jgi:hypothetical protein
LWLSGAGAVVVDPVVAHRPQQIGEIAVVADEPWAFERAGVRFLGEVLGVLAGLLVPQAARSRPSR